MDITDSVKSINIIQSKSIPLWMNISRDICAGSDVLIEIADQQKIFQAKLNNHAQLLEQVKLGHEQMDLKITQLNNEIRVNNQTMTANFNQIQCALEQIKVNSTTHLQSSNEEQKNIVQQLAATTDRVAELRKTQEQFSAASIEISNQIATNDVYMSKNVETARDTLVASIEKLSADIDTQARKVQDISTQQNNLMAQMQNIETNLVDRARILHAQNLRLDNNLGQIGDELQFLGRNIQVIRTNTHPSLTFLERVLAGP